MNFTQYLSDYLKKNGQVDLPGFGTFFMKTAHATLDKTGKNLLPPGLEIVFSNQNINNNNLFAEYLASEKQIPLSAAQIEIRNQIAYWKIALQKDGEALLSNFGTLIAEEETLRFTPTTSEQLSPDFYGLEEINIQALKQSKTIAFPSEQNAYKFPKNAFWVLPLVLGVLALSYLSISQPEILFGQRTKDLLNKKEEQKKPAPQKSKVDSATNTAKKDSLTTIKTDSISHKDNSTQ